MKLLLVDSSAWIQTFSKQSDPKLTHQILGAKKNKRLATCGMVYLEVCRGGRTKKEFQEIQEEFLAMHWLIIENLHWQLACEMGFQLMQKGFHPPATDLLIAATAIQYDCQLLHQDKHFLQIARYFPLRLV
ncbi:MAG: PIN domain-containing protein [Deltaproteobacteria bacterium]|nr:PIN domain-containing protein [Deltaproteobacteria bacterium]